MVSIKKIGYMNVSFESKNTKTDTNSKQFQLEFNLIILFSHQYCERYLRSYTSCSVFFRIFLRERVFLREFLQSNFPPRKFISEFAFTLKRTRTQKMRNTDKFTFYFGTIYDRFNKRSGFKTFYFLSNIVKIFFKNSSQSSDRVMFVFCFI